MSFPSALLPALVNTPVHASLMAFVIGYGLGAIPFGLLLTRFAGLGDVRQIGSGNIGATNVLRTGNKVLAATTLLLDALKGAIAVLIAFHLYGLGAAWLAGLGAFLGHVFPVWLKFRGGKGVATYLGVSAAISWPAGVIFAISWIGVAVATRLSSLAGITAALAVPLYFAVTGQFEYATLTAIMALVLLYKHSSNIRRLRRGEEPRIGAKS